MVFHVIRLVPQGQARMVHRTGPSVQRFYIVIRQSRLTRFSFTIRHLCALNLSQYNRSTSPMTYSSSMRIIIVMLVIEMHHFSPFQLARLAPQPVFQATDETKIARSQCSKH